MIEEITIKFGIKLKPTMTSWKSQLYKYNEKDGKERWELGFSQGKSLSFHIKDWLQYLHTSCISRACSTLI